MAEDATDNKMIPAFHFAVSFVDDGISVEDAPSVPFSEVSGLSIDMQTEDLQEGGGNNYTIRLPKPPKFKNLVLKRALSATSPTIVDWARKAVEDFTFSTKTVIVSLRDYEDKSIKSWSFEGAYPVKLSVSDFNAGKNELVIQTLELAYRRFFLTADRNGK